MQAEKLSTPQVQNIPDKLNNTEKVNENAKHRKKKFRYFDSYIPKIIKKSFGSNGITSDARQQLNSILIMFATKITDNTLRLTRFTEKRTLSVKEVNAGVALFLSGDLKKNALSEGENAVKKYVSNTDKKGSSRQDKASIIFPPSITEKFLRRFDTSSIMVTHTAPVYMAAVLEYICIEMIDLASMMAKDDHRVRITVSDLELSIKGDIELSKLFIDNNIRFLGGGVQQWIHPNLLVKKNAKPTIRTKSVQEKKYKSGTIAIKDIKKYQKMGNTLIFAKQPFEKFVRQILNEQKNSVKVSKNVFTIIQYVIEDYLVKYFVDANAAAIHAGRVKLMIQDLEFVRSCRLGHNFSINITNKLNNSTEQVAEPVDKVVDKVVTEPVDKVVAEPVAEQVTEPVDKVIDEPVDKVVTEQFNETELIEEE